MSGVLPAILRFLGFPGSTSLPSEKQTPMSGRCWRAHRAARPSASDWSCSSTPESGEPRHQSRQSRGTPEREQQWRWSEPSGKKGKDHKLTNYHTRKTKY